MRKAFVLLSGGLDSTTCLFKAILDYLPKDPGIDLSYGDPYVITQGFKAVFQDNWGGAQFHVPWVEAISVDYGQRHKKEMDYAASTCEKLGIKHSILNIGDILSGKGVMLTDSKVEIPNISYDEIQGVSPTFVPFRNGTLLSLITAIAQKWVNENMPKESRELQLRMEADGFPPDLPEAGIYFGAHAEDAHNWAYPDCTPEFIGAMANAIYIGTYRTIRLHTPLQWLKKAEIVTLGDKLGVPFQNTWSCYAGGELHCGTCPTCRSRRDAFRTAGIQDPTKYAA